MSRSTPPTGTTLFGLFGVGLAYFFLYWGLQEATLLLASMSLPRTTITRVNLVHRGAPGGKGEVCAGCDTAGASGPEELDRAISGGLTRVI